MIDLSFAGLIGAFLGTMVAAFAYAPLLSFVHRAFTLGATPEESGLEASREELALLRRAVLALDIIVFAGFGYWLAAMLAG
jgi:hypothetical protein